MFGLLSIRRFSTKLPPHIIIKMPALSPTMTSGNLGIFFIYFIKKGTWKKKIGDEIIQGDVLVEIETDKATMVLLIYYLII